MVDNGPSAGSASGTRQRRGAGRRASDAARRSSSRHLWSPLPDHVFEIDSDERIVFANHPLPRLPVERLIGTTLSGQLPVDHRRALREACLIARETGRIHTFETTTEGRPPWWLYRVVRLPASEETAANLLVVRTDITLLKQASQTLAEETRQYRMAFESAKTGMAITGVDGTFLMVNRALCDLLGFTESELLATDIYAVTHPDDLAASATQARRLLMGKTDTVMVEKRYFHRDGHVIWCRVCATAAADRDGVTQQFVTIVQDISEVKEQQGDRQRHERQAAEADRLNSMQGMAGHLAESLQSFLEEVGIRADELSEFIGSDPAGHTTLQALQSSAGRLRDQLTQLQTLSGRRVPTRTPVPVDRLVSEVCEQVVAGGDHPRVRQSLAERLPLVECDADQIQLALTALIDNAREAAPGGGEVIIESQTIRLTEAHCREHPGLKPGGYCQITVSDPGEGMPTEIQKRIFDPFFTTKSRQVHRGVGLPMALAIAQQHGGTLTVYSEVGHGTSCKLFLPVEDTVTVAHPPMATARASETILLAEDEEALTSVARRILERLGYTVLTAVDGVEALHMFVAGRDQIDLVLLDMSMPRMGGVEAYDRIRSIDRSVPIGFMTGYSAEMALASLAHSQAVLIPKPYGIEELSRTVREMLDRDPDAGSGESGSVQD